MSKKIELTSQQITECLRMYNDELLGSTTISKTMGIHNTIIRRTLKENGIIFGPSGRRFIGGKSASDKRHYKKHKAKKSKYHKEWRKNNLEDLKNYHTSWREDNKEHVNKYKRDYERKRRAEDPKYRLGIRTRTAVWQLLKERNINAWLYHRRVNEAFRKTIYSRDDLGELW